MKQNKKYLNINKRKHRRLPLVFVFSLILALLYFLYDQNFNHQSERIRVNLDYCIDGDSAMFNEIGETRFIMIDTPEKSTPEGLLVSDYVCRLLKEAQVIEIENDSYASLYDRYHRRLAWVFIDGQLIQATLASQGYVVRFFDYKGYSTNDAAKVGMNPKYVNEVVENLKKDNSYWGLY